MQTIPKSELMDRLIRKRCRCHACGAVQNKLTLHNAADGPTWDSDAYIGQWTAWNGNLDAGIMVVGQDWGTKSAYNRFKETQRKNASYDLPFEPDNPTNLCLARCIAQLNPDWNILAPLENGNNARYPLFFTNEILCYKDTPRMNDAIPAKCYRECVQNFLLQEIEIVRPKVLVFLGQAAFWGFIKVAPQSRLSRKVKREGSFYSLVQSCLAYDTRLLYRMTDGQESLVVPMFHTGFYGQYNRRAAERKSHPEKEPLSGSDLLAEDWKKLKMLVEQQWGLRAGLTFFS